MKNKLLTGNIKGSAVYILPNLLTTGNMFFGYFSIVKAMHGDFAWAAGSILLAAVFDILDGRVARLTKGTSEFGVQYDSLCDLVSFGVAPAFLMYQYAFSQAGRLGWIVCFLFLACGALRLARFNVQSAIGKADGDFVGLPIPMAAAVPACFVAMVEDFRHDTASGIAFIDMVATWMAHPSFVKYFLLATAPVLAGLMVSNVSYRSHKTINFAIKPFKLLVIAVALVGLIAYRPSLIGFTLFFLYALSGLIEYALGWKKPSDDDEFFADPDDEDDETQHGRL